MVLPDRARFQGARLPGMADLPDGEHRTAHAGGRRFVVVRSGDERYACENRCLHIGVRLSEGLQHGAVLECRWHHWKHDLSTGSILSDESPFATFETFDVTVDGEDLVIAATPRTVLRRRPRLPIENPRQE